MSGTVAGAIEGMALGVPSIALSQGLTWKRDEEPAIHFDTAETFGPGLVRRLVEVGWPAGVIMNVNFPGRPPEEVEAVEVTRQAFRDIQTRHFERRTDLRGRDYYWLGFTAIFRRNRPMAPTCAPSMMGNISVTPLHIDLTHMQTVHDLRAVLGGAPPKLMSADEPFDEPRDPAGAAHPVAALAGRHRPGGAGGDGAARRATSSRRTCSRSAPGRTRRCRSPAARRSASPIIVGLMTQALMLEPRARVLEIGTGSGYQTAVLSRLARLVYTVERYRTLLAEAEARFRALRARQHHHPLRRRRRRLAGAGAVRPHSGHSSGAGRAQDVAVAAQTVGNPGRADRPRPDPDAQALRRRRQGRVPGGGAVRCPLCAVA